MTEVLQKLQKNRRDTRIEFGGDYFTEQLGSIEACSNLDCPTKVEERFEKLEIV